MKLKELEKRLEKEPENLGLRVTVAGLLHEAGRTVEAVELYRSVALAYRDGGRKQQAIAVCRSILELAPEDEACRSLLSSLIAPASGVLPPVVAQRPSPGPKRRSSMEPTPLPKPVPYHVVDPTSGIPRQAAPSTPDVTTDRDLPAVEGADTRPGDEPRPQTTGLAQAARRISGWIASADRVPGERADDLAAELDTRPRPRIDSATQRALDKPPPTVPVDLVDDALTPPARDTPTRPRDSDDELTQPRDRPDLDDDEP